MRLLCLLVVLAFACASCALNAGSTGRVEPPPADRTGRVEPPLAPADRTSDPPVNGPVSPVNVTMGPEPLPLDCTLGDIFRCKGNTKQACNYTTFLWEDFQSCSARHERCSSAPKDCDGLAKNCAQCVP